MDALKANFQTGQLTEAQRFKNLDKPFVPEIENEFINQSKKDDIGELNNTENKYKNNPEEKEKQDEKIKPGAGLYKPFVPETENEFINQSKKDDIGELNNTENKYKNNPEEKEKQEEKIKPGAGLYKPFVPETENEFINQSKKDDIGELNNTENKYKNNPEEKEKQDSSIIEDSPYYPILKGLLKQGHLDLETFNTTIETLSLSSNNEEQKAILEKTIEGIKSINREQKTVIIEGFKGVENVTEDNFEKTKFFADFQDPETGAKPKGNDLDLLLAENYIKIPRIDGKIENRDNDLNVTINIVSNKIIKNHSKDFRDNNGELINEIRNTKDMGVKYQKVRRLLKESKNEDAKKGSKQLFSFKKNKEKKEGIIDFIDKRFEQLKNDYEKAKVINDKVRLKEIQEEGEELKKDPKVSGEVFEGLPELEEILSHIEDTLKEQA